MKQHIKIGTRGSQLARVQAELVRGLILQNFSLFDIELVVIKTSGDMVRRGRFLPFETKRMFTREIEEALLKKEVDLAVHSAKDLSVQLPEGLEIGAALEREDPRDCLISKEKKKLSEFPLGARIGTSSIRRRMQLLRWHPDLLIEEVRGNVDTRIRKIEEGAYDGVVLAHAGVKRLGLSHYVADIFPSNRFYPAPGQGTIAIETRAGDPEVAEVVRVINHEESLLRLRSERAFLRRLEGGCQLPCGISTEIEGKTLLLEGALFAIESREWAEAKHQDLLEKPEQAGEGLAEIILANGGQKILEQMRQQNEGAK